MVRIKYREWHYAKAMEALADGNIGVAQVHASLASAAPSQPVLANLKLYSRKPLPDDDVWEFSDAQ